MVAEMSAVFSVCWNLRPKSARLRQKEWPTNDSSGWELADIGFASRRVQTAGNAGRARWMGLHARTAGLRLAKQTWQVAEPGSSTGLVRLCGCALPRLPCCL